MPTHDTITTVEGEVSDVFANRFVLRTSDLPVLADLGPKGAKAVCLKAGDKVKLTGKQTSAEFKVTIVERGGEKIEIAGEKEHAPAEPIAALRAVAALGHTVVGQPHRKPKHFELLARDDGGAPHEHHVEFDGTITKSKPGNPGDAKWKAAQPKAS